MIRQLADVCLAELPPAVEDLRPQGPLAEETSEVGRRQPMRLHQVSKDANWGHTRSIDRQMLPLVGFDEDRQRLEVLPLAVRQLRDVNQGLDDRQCVLVS